MDTKTLAKLVKAGNCVDAADIQGKWRVAEVIEVSASRDVRVHFLGHKGDDDETIPAGQVADRTAYLYTHTPDRRNWAVGDRVDFQCSAEYDVWMPAQITIMNREQAYLYLTVGQGDIEQALRTHGAPISAAKIWKSASKSLCSDDIAPLGTHTSHASKKRKCTHNDATVPSLAALPAPLPTWLAPFLRAQLVSETHIVHCDQALVRDEGFTTSALFAAVPATELTVYLRELGITARGVLLNLVEVHKALQVHASGGTKLAIKVA